MRLMAEEFDSAFLGVAVGETGSVAVYDHELCARVLERDGFFIERAREWVDENAVKKFHPEGGRALLVRRRDLRELRGELKNEEQTDRPIFDRSTDRAKC